MTYASIPLEGGKEFECLFIFNVVQASLFAGGYLLMKLQ